FEQFCINLTNEKLQQHFNQHVFKMEQEEYSKEEINWSYIEFVDNQDILDLIEKKQGGILALLDEACMFPRSTHTTFADKLYHTFKDHKRFSKPKLSNTDFTICHYAGDVTYQSDSFLDKNKDYVVAEHQALMNASKCFFVSSLFPPLAQDSSKASKFISIGSQFKGVMEAIRISCAGFPTRKPFHEFIDRFKIFSPNVITLSDEVEASRILLKKANLEGYQIGKTKVFLRAGQMAEIDARRSEVLGRSATKIQTKFRGYTACNKYILLRSSALVIQTICRGELARVCYKCRRIERACLRIQKNVRMHRERTRYKFMSSSVISIQNGMRGMAARNAYNYKKQIKAAIGIQSRWRQHLALRHYVKMRKVAVYTQSVSRKDLAHIQLRSLRKIANDTGVLQDAKSKLEKEAKELAMRLQEEERNRSDMEEAKKEETLKLQFALKEMETQLADMEEAKNKETAELQSAIKELEIKLADMEETKKENAKLQSAIEEMEVQFQETKELLEAAKADNEKLKDAVSSLELEISETQKKYEETSKLSEDRLKEAMDAEAKIIDLKIDMQSLQEKIADMETEDRILRQKEHESGSPSKKFDSNLTNSTIGKERVCFDMLFLTYISLWYSLIIGSAFLYMDNSWIDTPACA
ncbi:hypothetical protein M8C21_006221, partial [Ambrosia artemisiifolia]